MTIKDSPSKAMAVSAADQVSDLGALLDGHIAREFADLDVDAAMKTMVPEPYVHCVPIMTGAPAGRVSAFFTASTS